MMSIAPESGLSYFATGCPCMNTRYGGCRGFANIPSADGFRVSSCCKLDTTAKIASDSDIGLQIVNSFFIGRVDAD
jgi:hypothetical protein